MHWLLFVLIGAAVAALANISLKHGLTQINAVLPRLSLDLQSIYHLVSNLYIWLGLCGLGIGFFFWLLGLSQTKLNSGYPIFVGTEYCLVMLLSWLILSESFSLAKIAAIVLILIGIIIIFVVD